MLTRKTKTGGLVGTWLLMWLFLLGLSQRSASAQETRVAAPLTTDQVVLRMVGMNEQRAQALRSYTAMRVYHLEYHGVKDISADVVVKMSYRSPNTKEFTIVSEEGSKLLRNRVLKRLIEAEREATKPENLKKTAIHPNNYEFRLVGYERTPLREFYVLQAEPKTKNKFLFSGRIWVDAKDFAIVRVEGEPAQNPSWWTKRNLIQHSYKKVGDFWLPARNETATELRLLGRSLLTIEYQDYELTATAGLNTNGATEHSIPNVTTVKN